MTARQEMGGSQLFAMIRKYEGVGSVEVIALAAKEQFSRSSKNYQGLFLIRWSTSAITQ
jgi:hypothetical protein